MVSILYLLLTNFENIPWVGLIVAISWSVYNLLKKKVLIDTDIGLLVEFISVPFVLIIFYFISQNNYNDFTISDPGLMVIFMMAGPMTVIPLFLYVKGVELWG